MTRSRSQAGVTLLELLISVTLVALLSVGLLFAMRVGFTAMDRSNDRLMSNRRVVSVERILEGQIADIMPVTALCMSDDGPTARIAFFQGETATMRFVSSYSLHEASRGYPMLLEFHVIPGQNDEGVRLVVNETLYSGPKSAGLTCTGAGDGNGPPQFRPVQIGANSFVLADKLAFCRLSYREDLPPPDGAHWVILWNKRVLPSAIRIEMASLNPGAAKLQLMTLTIPVHVNRYPLERYDF